MEGRWPDRTLISLGPGVWWTLAARLAPRSKVRWMRHPGAKGTGSRAIVRMRAEVWSLDCGGPASRQESNPQARGDALRELQQRCGDGSEGEAGAASASCRRQPRLAGGRAREAGGSPASASGSLTPPAKTKGASGRREAVSVRSAGEGGGWVGGEWGLARGGSVGLHGRGPLSRWGRARWMRCARGSICVQLTASHSHVAASMPRDPPGAEIWGERGRAGDGV